MASVSDNIMFTFLYFTQVQTVLVKLVNVLSATGSCYLVASVVNKVELSIFFYKTPEYSPDFI